MALIKSFTVEEEMKKNLELKKSDLDMLRDWLKKQPHLPTMSDTDLILFLHSNYYRLESTKTTIDTFFTLRTHAPDILSQRDPLGSKEVREIMKVMCILEMPSTTPHGYKLIYIKLIDAEPSRYVTASTIKLFTMAIELWLYTKGTSPGHVVVMDLDGVQFGHVPRFNIMAMKKVLCYVQEALPIRLKAVHVINTVPFIDLFLNLCRPFIKKELMDILSFHSSTKTLSDKIPIDLLPNDLGGKGGLVEDLWAAQVNEFEEHRGWFLEEETRKVNEAARPGKAKNATDLFGIEGSFKKLEID